MNRKTFLVELDNLLSPMSSEDRTEILYDYQEHIQAAMETGKSEEEAVASLGSPKLIAKELLADYYLGKAEVHRTPRNVMRAVMATISLGFFNLVVMVGPIVACIGVLIAVFASAVALIIAPVASEFAMLIGIGTSDLPFLDTFFPLLACFGAGLLLLTLALLLGKSFGKLLIRYARFNARIIRGGN